MKSCHLYEVSMVDGRCYRGEIAYRDDKMIVLKVRNSAIEHKLRLFYHSIMSIHDLGWQKSLIETTG